MEKFRNLTKNIFFKIILGFVALSFVLFGVSGFILGNPNDWVAKIGNSKISVNKFNVALKNDREIIFAKTDSEEAIKYSESDQFKQVVLNRLVGRELAQKLVEEADFKPNRELVFRAIAKDQTFKGEDGKFDKNKFQNFLTNNGLDEKRYIEAVENNIVNSVISQSVAAASIVNE
jgi:peptidyl-prolyl cis-trans isomerase D